MPGVIRVPGVIGVGAPDPGALTVPGAKPGAGSPNTCPAVGGGWFGELPV